MKIILLTVMLLVCGTAAAQTLFNRACPGKKENDCDNVKVVIFWKGTNYNVNVT